MPPVWRSVVWDLVATSSVVAAWNQILASDPASLEPVFAVSILGYCRHMVGYMDQDQLTLQISKAHSELMKM